MIVSAQHDNRPIGLISALPEEHRYLGLEGSISNVAGFTFISGRLNAQPVVLAECGVGKVNAAMVATLLLHQFNCRALLFTGVAGGLDPALDIGDIVIGQTLIQHDYGALIDGDLVVYQAGAFPLPGHDTTHGYHLPPGLGQRIIAALTGLALPELPALATGGQARKPAVQMGTILTGDTFVNCEASRQRLQQRHRAQAVEMEGAAVAQVATRFDVPFVVVRCLSDLAGRTSAMDFYSFLPIAAESAARISHRLLPLL